jgi:hypothetical protein
LWSQESCCIFSLMISVIKSDLFFFISGLFSPPRRIQKSWLKQSYTTKKQKSSLFWNHPPLLLHMSCIRVYCQSGTQLSLWPVMSLRGRHVDDTQGKKWHSWISLEKKITRVRVIELL